MVLAHLSRSLFTSQALLLLLGSAKLFWQQREETLIATGNNVKQIILRNVLRRLFGTERCYVIKYVILGNLLLSRYALWTVSTIKVTLGCADFEPKDEFNVYLGLSRSD